MSSGGAQRAERSRDAGAEPQPGDGSERVRLKFLPDGAEVRVPSGTPVFDAASWNGIAIDSTCGGYGTCKKCKVRIVSGDLPVGPIDPRAFTAAELEDGWRLACRAAAREDLVVEVPPLQTRPKAALAGVGPPRDPASVGTEAPPGDGGADARGSASGYPAGAGRDRGPRARPLFGAPADARRHAAGGGVRRDRGGRR